MLGISNFTIIHEVHTKFQIELFVYQLQGNEYRLTPFKIARTNFCDYYIKEREYNSATFDAFGVPDKCPIPKKTYSGQTDFDFSKIPANFDGRYKIWIKYYRFGRDAGSLQLFGEVRHYPSG